MLNKMGCYAFEFTVQPGSKQRINNYLAGRDGMKVLFRLYEMDIRPWKLVQPGKIGLKIIRAFVTKLKNINGDNIFFFHQHPGDGQPITTVISLTAKDTE